MTGNGAGGTPADVGNLILLSGDLFIRSFPVPAAPPWAWGALAALLLAAGAWLARTQSAVNASRAR